MQINNRVLLLVYWDKIEDAALKQLFLIKLNKINYHQTCFDLEFLHWYLKIEHISILK